MDPTETPERVYAYEYRASSLGSCLKSLIAARLGYEPLDVYSGMQIMAEGNLHEGDVLRRLREQGWIISREQEECERILPGFNVRITGHNDGIIQWQRDKTQSDSPLVLEIKSMGDSSFKDWKKRGWSNPGLIQKYKWQVSFYMEAYQMPLMFVVKNRNSGEIDTDFVRLPFYSWDEIVSRIAKIELAAAQNDLPTSCEWAMFPCPFDYLHEDTDGEEIVITDQATEDLVRTFLTLRDERDRLVDDVKELGKQIKERTNGKKITLPFATGYETERRIVTYDYDKMRGDGIDLDKYERVDFTRSYTIRKKNKDATDKGSSQVSEPQVSDGGS